MGNIIVLDELTINQIAAGEVIERPANVVKELAENSIDAGATAISIEIKNGGITYIRITDNGKGISKDDMEIAFERHATSKIRSSDDLLNVTTMGFRGEALASIAAISEVEMISCTQDSSIGNIIKVKAGDITDFAEFGCPKGTTITVKDLFFNTPVRYKFLKKDFTEGGYIEDIVTKLALIHPEIAFKLISSGKQIISTSGNGKLNDVVYTIYGKEISDFTIPVDYTYEDMKVTGLVGRPEIARSNRANQITFVNTRHVKNKTMSSAIDEAYRTIVQPGKFAFVVLNLQLKSELVDVNVHPAKLEIRFQNESEVFKAIYHAVKNSLLGNDLSRIIHDSSEKQNEIADNVIKDLAEEKNKNEVKQMFSKFTSVYSGNNESQREDIKEEVKEENEKSSLLEEEHETYENINGVETVKQEVTSTLFDTENRTASEEKSPEYKYIGTAFETYNIIEYMGDMYIIDQHAAHERVLYEKVKLSYYSGEKLSQMLMIPEVVNLTNREFEIVKENISMFEKAGYMLEEFGDNSYKITGVPYICLDIQIKELFMEILDELQGNRTNMQDVEDKFLATIACKAAVKANMNLKDEEIKELLAQMLKLDNPFSCPHGRPTAIRMSKYEIERKFGRK